MAAFVEVPFQRLDPAVLGALLEDFASRDGTDYGEREHTLVEKTAQLHGQLVSGDLALLYDADSEQWDLVARDYADSVLSD
ncbi:MAG: YheU family protein [Halieaceae bacterium]